MKKSILEQERDEAVAAYKRIEREHDSQLSQVRSDEDYIRGWDDCSAEAPSRLIWSLVGAILVALLWAYQVWG